MDKKDFSWAISTINELELISFNEKIVDCKENMAQKNIYIFGAGIRGCMFLTFCKMSDINVMGFVDNDKNKVNGCIGELPIVSYDDLKNNAENYFLIISPEVSENITIQLDQDGLKHIEDYFFVEPVLYNQFIEDFFTKNKNKYLFLGDCIFEHVGLYDEKKESLGTMLLDVFGRDEARVLGMHGMPVRTFYHLLRLQNKLDRKPENVILVVNTVMFFGKKNQLPRAQHTPLLQEIRDRLPFSDEEYNEYVDLTQDRMERFNTDAFARTNISEQKRNEKKINDFRLKMNYMGELDLKEEGIVYLCKMIQFCKTEHINLHLVLPPINYEYGMGVYGEEFKKCCDRTIETLKSYFRNSFGVEMLDMSYLLDSECFASSDTINEITNYQGRKREVEFLKEHCLQ